MKNDTLSRLLDLRSENDSARLQMAEDAPRFQALKNRHENGTAPRAVSSFNLFQTPPELAERMAALLPTGCRSILEPSAGLGRLYRAARAVSDARITLIEESADCCAELYQMTSDDPEALLLQKDFLTLEPVIGARFDCVIMNPPFERGRDIKHTRHALKFLSSGGLLIGLCYNGAKQSRELKPLAESWEVLPVRTFAKEGTGADVVLFTIKG